MWPHWIQKAEIDNLRIGDIAELKKPDKTSFVGYTLHT